MANNKTSMSLNVALVLVLLLTISVAESKRTFAVAGGFLKASSTPQCATVVGVASGDTCSGIEQEFGLTTEFFDSINPNLNCDDLFVGQWLCVAGSA